MGTGHCTLVYGVYWYYCVEFKIYCFIDNFFNFQTLQQARNTMNYLTGDEEIIELTGLLKEEIEKL